MEAHAHITQADIARSNNVNEVVNRESGRLFGFIRKQVKSLEDAEDILQDVFSQYSEATSYLDTIEQSTAWLYKVARNKITDLFRKKKTLTDSALNPSPEEKEFSSLLAALTSDEDPELDYTKSLVLEELQLALEELPTEQREAFVQNEIEGRSFKELALESGETVNTLISRKRYAVLHLRKRLQSIYNELINE